MPVAEAVADTDTLGEKERLNDIELLAVTLAATLGVFVTDEPYD